MTTPAFVTRAAMVEDLRALGLAPGDVVLAHGALSGIGRLLNGPDAVVGALLDAVSPGGTVLAYTDWDARYDELLDDEGRVPDEWRPHVPPFDPMSSRANRENGALPEFLRTWPGAHRSANPGASFAAVGARSQELTADHAWDFGYGPGSPLARLVGAGGKVVMVGAPWDTMTLLHHAEHLADLPGKRLLRYEVPVLVDGEVAWRSVEELDTSVPVVEGPEEDYFTEIVTDFVTEHPHRRGRVGAADTLVVDAEPMCRFAVGWLEERYGTR